MCILIGMVIFLAWLGIMGLIGKLYSKRIAKEGERVSESMYTYYCLKRPPSTHTLPGKGLIHASAFEERRYVFEIDQMAYGSAMYNRPLAPWEIMRYDLASEPGAEDR